MIINIKDLSRQLLILTWSHLIWKAKGILIHTRSSIFAKYAFLFNDPSETTRFISAIGAIAYFPSSIVNGD